MQIDGICLLPMFQWSKGHRPVVYPAIDQTVFYVAIRALPTMLPSYCVLAYRAEEYG